MDPVTGLALVAGYGIYKGVAMTVKAIDAQMVRDQRTAKIKANLKVMELEPVFASAHCLAFQWKAPNHLHFPGKQTWDKNELTFEVQIKQLDAGGGELFGTSWYTVKQSHISEDKTRPMAVISDWSAVENKVSDVSINIQNVTALKPYTTYSVRVRIKRLNSSKEKNEHLPFQKKTYEIKGNWSETVYMDTASVVKSNGTLVGESVSDQKEFDVLLNHYKMSNTSSELRISALTNLNAWITTLITSEQKYPETGVKLVLKKKPGVLWSQTNQRSTSSLVVLPGARDILSGRFIYTLVLFFIRQY